MIQELVLYFPYIGIWLLIILGGFGLPFPEDLSLILAGQLSFSEKLNLPLMMVVCFSAIMPTDYLLFYIGQRYGRAVWRIKIFRRFMTPQRRIRVRDHFKNHGNKVVFVARFIGGFRTPVFITAGILKMPAWKFLAMDAFAALISIPLFVLSAFYLGQTFAQELQVVAHKMTWFLMLVMSLFFVWALFQAFRKPIKSS
ncbi:MAG: DedA family protein [Deltaproteobacteria bacterium]|nr:DedA family protein [Deltaproteobacteria bacterium]